MTRRFATPDKTRIYAVGDLHGHRDALQAMMDKINEDARGRSIAYTKIVFLGDYIDRGPDSAGLVDDLIELSCADLLHHIIFLQGNHEDSWLTFMENPMGERHDWLHWGGIETMTSYGVIPDPIKPMEGQAPVLVEQMKEKVPVSHFNFMQDLAPYYQCGDYLFVHAGVRPNVPIAEQSKYDLLMIRDGFLDYQKLHPWRIVHGHTVTREPEILPNRINVDTGLYKHGVLSCAVLEGDQVDIMQVRV